MPEIKWLHSFATLGRIDVVDIVESPDTKQIEKAAMIIRAYGHATAETPLATPLEGVPERALASVSRHSSEPAF